MKKEQIDPAMDDIMGEPSKVSNIKKAPKPPSKAEQAKEWQSNAEELVESALAAVPTIIAGVTLYSFSTARGSLLRKAGNEFVQGIAISEIEDPFLAVGKFLILMSEDLTDARKLVANLDNLETAAYELLDRLPISSVPTVVSQVNAFVHKEMSNQVHGTLPDNGEEGESKSPKNS